MFENLVKYQIFILFFYISVYRSMNLYSILTLPRIKHENLHVINTKEKNKRSLPVGEKIIVRVMQTNNNKSTLKSIIIGFKLKLKERE